jgi:hypothetical protein
VLSNSKVYTSCYVSAIAAALVETVIFTALVTLLLEGRRKREIRRALELSFLNHHTRNVITQLSIRRPFVHLT